MRSKFLVNNLKGFQNPSGLPKILDTAVAIMIPAVPNEGAGLFRSALDIWRWWLGLQGEEAYGYRRP